MKIKKTEKKIDISKKSVTFTIMKDRIVYVVYSHSRVQLGRLCFLGWGETEEDAMIDAYGDVENARRWLRKRDGAMLEAFELSDAYAMFGEWQFMG